MFSEFRSPEKKINYLPFKPSWSNKLNRFLRSPGYYVLLSNQARTLLDALAPYPKLSVSRSLQSLFSHPRPVSAQAIKASADQFMMKDMATGYNIHYQILSGKIFVMTISR